MKVYGRSRITLCRLWRRNLVFFFLVLMMGILLSTILLIVNSVESVERNLWAQIPSVVIFVEDTERTITDEGWNLEAVEKMNLNITPSFMKNIYNLPYVKKTEYFHRPAVSLYSNKYENLKIVMPFGEINSGECRWTGQQLFEFTGIQRPGSAYFSEGVISLYSGRDFKENDFLTWDKGIPVILPKDLAFHNGWNIGSEFTLQQQIIISLNRYETELISQKDFVFQVIGLFDWEATSGNRGVDDLKTWYFTNRLLFPAEAAHEMEAFEETVLQNFGLEPRRELSFSFRLRNQLIFLHSSEEMPQFIEAASDLLAPYYMTVWSPATFLDVVAALTIFDVFSTNILWGLPLLIIIWVLLLLLFLQSRKEEYRLYLYLGEKK